MEELPKDWKDRAARGFGNLNRAGVEGVCFWCGHQYGIGAHSAETDSDHLLHCPQCPKEAKRK